MKLKRLLYFITFIQIISSAFIFAQRWEKVVSMSEPYLSNYWLDVYFLPSNPNYGWVCGFGGMVIRTSDGGNTWRGSTISGAYQLEGIHFPSVSVGYTSGQDGIFKSTDGGASWFNVSPTSATASMWGCYFLNNDNGFVIGGGCLSNQEFWRTTDGGNSWSVFVGNLSNSGLTDLIVYSMLGSGYASSSGWIWQTTDGGVTWSPWRNTGPNDWQEEITKVGSSFLVPTTSGCSGGGGGGGMRFTTDDGISWNTFNTGVRMFGSFLLSPQTGWVAGDSRNVWYTTNGGVNWVLRNCGFDNGNLDDIWFITSNNGWIVGEGVYRLANPLQRATKTSINFGEVCMPGDSIDFTLLENINFNSDNVNVSIFNDPDNEFSIVSPGTNFTINSCETIRLNIKFSPKTVGNKTASLRIDFGFGTNVIINLAGYGVSKTIAPKDTLLIINPAYCGNDNVYGVLWTAATDRESISNIQYYDGSNEIVNRTMFPLKIPSGGVQSLFSANPVDTGWFTTRFRCFFEPCPADTYITVKAYGVSPIITSQVSSSLTLKCDLIGYDTIPIFNTGNSNLVISDAKIFETNTNYSIAGWKTGKLPIIIAPNASNSIIVQLTKNPVKSNIATLQLINNDLTIARGIKSPCEIKLYGNFVSSNLVSQDTVVDFGRVCITEIEFYNFFLFNLGDFDLTLDQAQIASSQYQVTFNATNYPIVLKPGDSVRCNITFRPDRIGNFSDTVYINSQPCNDLIKVAVKGIGISTFLDTDPPSFSANFQTNTPFTRRLNVKSIGTEDFTLTKIELGTIVNNIQITVNPPLSQDIKFNGNMDFDVTFICTSDTIYDGYLCFAASGACLTTKCIPIHLQSYSTKVEFSRDSIDFGKFYCNPGFHLDTLWLTNTAAFTDTIIKLDLNPASSPFKVLNPLSLPFEIDANDSVPLYIEYAASVEGQHSATMSMSTSTAKNITKYLYLTAEFRKTDTDLPVKVADFGDVEQCDSQKQIIIKLHNRGTLQDSMIISSVNGFNSFVLTPNDYFIIPPLDSNEIIVSIDPASFAIGNHFAKISLSSQICPDVDTIDCIVNIFHNFLSYSPDTIKFGEVWVDNISTKYFKIENKSAYEKNIISMRLTPDDINFSLPGNYNYPLRFLPGDTLSIPVNFIATQQGNYLSSVQINEQSICLDSAFVYLTAQVPDEKYEATVSVGNYTTKPGQKITIAANLSNTIPNLKQKGLNYRFTFDPYLFLPTAMFVQGTNDKLTIPYSYNDGTISGQIDSTFTEIMLNTAGDILWIQGLVFLSNPDETPVNIELFEPITNKQVYITKIPGSLKLLEVCLPLADFKLEYIKKPVVFITKNPVTDGQLSLSIKSYPIDEFENLQNKISINLYTIHGEKISGFITQSFVDKIDLILDVSRYPSGVYYIVLDIGGYLLTERFIIMN